MPARNDSFSVYDKRFPEWNVVADADEETYFAFRDDELDDLIEILEEVRDR